MRRQRNTFKAKEQVKTPEEELSKVEISNLPSKEVEVMIIEMLNEFQRKMDEYSEKFNKWLKMVRIMVIFWYKK